MHKRARNHKLLTRFAMVGKMCGFTKEVNIHCWKKRYPQYEPQGKREARKYVKGLLYYKPSNFNKWYF